ncbi:MAG: alkaline phosphatase family protein [Alphaproteobacteria bacterium]|nr:alkaline phosphatase family protein [Alphaproteobacteria bacterium]
MANAKVLVIGLDSMEPSLIERWDRSGALPALRRLRERGLMAPLANLPGFGNGVYWPCIYTGVNPGEHGRYFFRQPLPGSYDIGEFFEDQDIRSEPFWCALSRAGRRVAIIDMVRAPLTPGLNGIQVVDWTTHDRSGQPRSWPPELISEINARFGTDPFHGRTDARDRGPEDCVNLLEKLCERITTKAEMSLAYLQKGGWDMFMTVFGEPHDIGHTLWHIHDSAHPWHDPALAKRMGDPLKAAYQAIDGAVGRLVDAAGPNATVVVVTGPGMGPNYSANHMLDEILRRIEQGGCETPPARPLSAKKAYRGLVPSGLRRRIRSLGARFGYHLTMQDRSQRKFHAVPHNEISGAVRFNLIGREPVGKVAPGAEYDAACAQLTEDLLEIVNLETGEPLVERVVRVADYCDGPHAADLADLLVVWHRPKPIRAIGSSKIGELRRETRTMRSGDHTARGTFIAAGPAIVSGTLERSFSPMDLTPTIAALLDLALPDAEGSIIPEVVGKPRAA